MSSPYTLTGLVLAVSLLTPIASPAQTDAPAPAPEPQVQMNANPDAARYEGDLKPYEKQRLSSTELVEFVDAVKGYVYGKPPTPETMKVFDVQKNGVVILKYVGIHADQSCHENLGNGFYAVCADMVEVSEDILKMKDDEAAVAEDADEYVLYFICRRKTEKEERVDDGYTYEATPLDQVTVRDVVIKSVNGEDRVTVTLGEDGMWRAEPIEPPDAP